MYSAGLRSTLCSLAAVVLPLVASSACISPGERAKLTQENEALRGENQRLRRAVEQRDGTVAVLHERIGNLRGLGPDRPVDLFAPVEVEIVRLTGGADYDSIPGDDGVTVYFRLRDLDGDTVKRPGRISVQLLDNTNLAAPRVLGLYVLDDPERVRKAWYGRFGTRHYSLKCPFPPGTQVPDSGRVEVKVEFIDYLTGATLTAMKEVTVISRHVDEAPRGSQTTTQHR
ncbi:MAG: hypothetical protein ACE5HE_02305 [Phycisphaerae bacterium]